MYKGKNASAFEFVLWYQHQDHNSHHLLCVSISFHVRPKNQSHGCLTEENVVLIFEVTTLHLCYRNCFLYLCGEWRYVKPNFNFKYEIHNSDQDDTSQTGTVQKYPFMGKRRETAAL